MSDIDKFYEDFDTLPKLISNLALAIADAQRRLDDDYLQSLGTFQKIVGELKGANAAIGTADFMALFKLIGPSRYQFTKTVVDVKADLQMTSGSEFSIGGSLGLKTPLLAVAVNASYSQRTSASFQASAQIHCEINAISSDEGVMTELLKNAAPVPAGTILPSNSAKPILDGLKQLVAPLAIVTDGNLPSTTHGTAMTAVTLDASGGTKPYTFAPAAGADLGGLELKEGKIGGTPTAAAGATIKFDVTVTDSSAPPLTASKTFTMTVK